MGNVFICIDLGRLLRQKIDNCLSRCHAPHKGYHCVHGMDVTGA
jgi:hypothetical protein